MRPMELEMEERQRKIKIGEREIKIGK